MNVLNKFNDYNQKVKAEEDSEKAEGQTERGVNCRITMILGDRRGLSHGRSTEPNDPAHLEG